MDNNDSFNSLGLEGVTLHDASTPTSSTPASATSPTTNPSASTTSTNPKTPEISDEELDNLSNDEVIDLFIRGIMEEKGVKASSPEVEKDIYEDLRTQLLAQIDRSLIAELPNDKLEELNKIALEQGQIDPTLIANMVADANLDVAEITGVTMQRFREIYLGQTPDGVEE